MKKKIRLIVFTILIMIISKNIYAAEIYEVDGNKYCKDENGEMLAGPVPIEGKIYFFSRAKEIYGQMKFGWQDDGINKFYLDDETGELKIGLFEYKGKNYYSDNNGYLQAGPVLIEGKTYFFSRANNIYGQMKYGWQDDGTHKFYLDDKTGELKTGLFEYKGKNYYADDSGYIQAGPIPVDGKTYFFSRANNIYGQMKYGMQDDGIHKFYLDDKTGELKTGLFEYKNKKYYADENGYLQGGKITIDNNIYFFSNLKSIYGQMKYGWQDDGIHKFYLDETTGVLVINKIFEYKGNKYYANEEGYIQGGFIPINGELYFFSRAKEIYGQLKHGWQSSDTFTYWYQDDAGKLVSGNRIIDGRDYYFNLETKMLDGFKTVNGKTYYYNPDGTQARGVQYMTNKYWKFNESTGAFEKFVRQIRVIDISQHNGDIDWNKVKQSGLVDAVILRLGFGSYSYDTRFNTNKAELERLGIPYSIYLFSYAERADQAQEEAEFVINSVRNKNINIASNIFGIYYDLEDWTINSTGQNSYGISKDTYGDIITTFVNDVERNLCIKTRVYASKNYIETRFPTGVQGYATWVAQWGNQITYQGAYEGWQYTSKADIPGIPWAWNKDTQQWEPHTDMSIFYY